MADLTFIVEVILSIAAVAVPIGLILALLVAGDYTVADLFMAPGWGDRGHGPVPTRDEAAPRWRLERLRPRAEDPAPPTNAGGQNAGAFHSSVRSLTFDESDC